MHCLIPAAETRIRVVRRATKRSCGLIGGGRLGLYVYLLFLSHSASFRSFGLVSRINGMREVRRAGLMSENRIPRIHNRFTSTRRRACCHTCRLLRARQIASCLELSWRISCIWVKGLKLVFPLLLILLSATSDLVRPPSSILLLIPSTASLTISPLSRTHFHFPAI
jgi:hypothetical protein